MVQQRLITLSFAAGTLGCCALSIWSANGWPLGYWPLVVLETAGVAGTVYRIVTSRKKSKRQIRRAIEETERACVDACRRLAAR